MKYTFQSALTCLGSMAILLSTLSSAARADTLYQATEVRLGPGHPLRLISDHRARQVGDLVAVLFNYSATSSAAASNAQKKGTDLSMGGGRGLAHLPLLSFPSGYNATSDSTSSKQKSDTSSFTTIMMATVIDVLASGALVIKGDENVMIDGQKHLFHVRGTVRSEDIDNTDTVISSRIADVDASFDGDSKADHHGLIQRVLDVFF